MARLFLDSLVQQYLDDFCACFGTRIAVYDGQGTELASGLGGRACAYCTLRRKDPAFEALCLASDRRGRTESAKIPGTLAYRCHGGMTEAIRCLELDGNTAGWVMIGQFRTQDPPPELSESLQRAFRRAPRRERLAPMLSIFDKLVDHMLATHRLRLLEELFVERARRYSAERLDRPIRIEQAAKDLGVSVSGLCHRFKAETGESFIAYHRRHRLEEGIDLLEQGAPVKEAALAVGFADPLHFSRAVKALRGVPPSALRGGSPPNPASSALRGRSLLDPASSARQGPGQRGMPQPPVRRGQPLGALPFDQRDGDADGHPAPGTAPERGVQIVGDPQGE